jgi:hypothetical protein
VAWTARSCGVKVPMHALWPPVVRSVLAQIALCSVCWTRTFCPSLDFKELSPVEMHFLALCHVLSTGGLHALSRGVSRGGLVALAGVLLLGLMCGALWLLNTLSYTRTRKKKLITR